ncbi:MAG: hypothetical protein AAB347_11760 [Bacteroidota bacterium]
MKLQKFFKFAIFAVALMSFGVACVKEGPPGKDGVNGATGAAGKDGKDANETCKMCHTPAKVDIIAVQFKYSKHETGEAALYATGRTSCSVCHTQEGFHDVVARKVPPTFTLNATTGKYVDNYISDISSAYGELLCRTCHSSIHETYNSTDLPKFTTTAPVDMYMWGGKKTIDLKQDGGISNLCIKCHQPRAFTAAADGNVLDYASLISKPTAIFFDAASPSTATMKPGYRTGTHYGTVGAIVAGMGGIEFPGTLGYASAKHATVASCADCHMAAMNGGAGGHSFNAIGNFKGCNVTGCHTGVTAADAKYWVNPRTTIKSLLAQLGAKLQYNGVQFMNKNSDKTSNLWYGVTTQNYDGYFNIYDPASNPNGIAMNSGTFQNPTPSGAWTAEQKAFNLTLPVIKITNAQFGAIINFQLCLREYSLGIHNLDYSKALLTNSLAVLN